MQVYIIENFYYSAPQWCYGRIGLPRNNGFTGYPPPRPKPRPGFPDGYTAYFGCTDEDRTLVGPTNSTCKNGTWSHMPGSCESEEYNILFKCC